MVMRLDPAAGAAGRADLGPDEATVPAGVEDGYPRGAPTAGSRSGFGLATLRAPGGR
jgi:hypothetical protein